MSNTFARSRAQRLMGGLTWFVVWAAAIGSLALVSAGVPAAWWPETGQAFAAGHPVHPQPTPAASEDSGACDLIVGPARRYCLMSDTGAAPSGTGDHAGSTPGGVLILVPVALGIGLAARQRRRAR
ncbi:MULTISPECIES: hypothetical protein [unclassified Streptomyces]|uniref:hypothetical protein n=1 Tax=unclassified Streptomyces TaxID=2593676 RepID=UPI00344C5118